MTKQLAAKLFAHIWRNAEVILPLFLVNPLNDNFCVTDTDKAFTVESKKGMLHCKNCVTSVAKGGLCQHSVAVAETYGTLLEHI